MAKTTSIREIEHTIEALSPVDQLTLLEKMVKHLKHSLLGGKTAVPIASSAKTENTLSGRLKQYANPALRVMEGEAFAQSMKEKHADR
jgi:hypothetical protein